MLFKLIEINQGLKPNQPVDTYIFYSSELFDQSDFDQPDELCLKLISLIETNAADQDDFTPRVIQSCLKETESLEACISGFKRLPVSLSLKGNIKKTLYILEDILLVD